ncbi:AAA family ATPase [Paucisalibacillus sp. EB02]|uniref:AAA family ATPase n=1 Tax=Paucisalibacillus sp. EB02 TaxID=1347087 RepID=UPI0004ACF12E|nr:AAA family ATPase [Paucisalibacillus sp. EB02]
MRAIKLSVTAFGPYLEKQTVDFDRLGDESIFLITGPTGAGKTTIFDAICYALYGKASGSDRDQDSLRSHFAAVEEPTEVEFRFALNNNVYEIIRNPKQFKKKERGEGYTEEPAKAVLYEIAENEKQLVASRIKDVNETIEEKLGFDYEQFRKMVLIPQGEFRKLISENSRDREAILQKIFRTHFYEKMTDELKAQSKQLEVQIKKLETDIQYEFTKVEWSHVPLQESDTNEQLLEKLKVEILETKKIKLEQQKIKEKQQEKVTMMEKRLQNASIIEEKFKEHESLLKENEQLEVIKDSIALKKDRLQLGKIAQQIIPFEEQSNARKIEWNTHVTRLREQEEFLRQIQNEFAVVKTNYQNAANKEQERENLKEEIKQVKKQLEQVNAYLELKKKAKNLKLEREKGDSELHSIEIELKDNEFKIVDFEKQLANEGILTKAFYETKEALGKQGDIKKKLVDYQLEHSKLIKLRKKYSIAQQLYKDKQEEIKRLEAQYDAFVLAQNEQYASVLASQLISGEPCPVCGSIHHPKKAVGESVEGNFEEIERLKVLIQKKKEEFESVQLEFVDHKTNGQTQRSVVDKLQDELNDSFPNITIESVQSIMTNVDNEIRSLEEKLKGITIKQKEIERIQREKESTQNKNKELKQTFDLISKRTQERKEELARTEAIKDEIEKQLPEDLMDPIAFTISVEEKEKQYRQNIQEWEQLKTSYEKTNEMLQKQTTVFEQLQDFEKETKANYELQYEKFINAIKENGFDVLEDYQNAKLSLEVQMQMEEEIEEFETAIKRIHYRLEQLKEQLVGVERVNLTEIEDEVTTYKGELQKTLEILLSLNAKINQDEGTLSRLVDVMKKIKELEEDYYIVGSLADLSSGNNALRLSFERYVLASFLDEILLQANIRLDRMTEHRYQLIRSGEVAKRGAQSGLDLEVMDHHTGITRSVRTLSGGEGFKAALSLALGLADVVQAHAGGVQLDTLFIDEGFGTLDEVSLQQAIDCLKDLQESNRLLGIISHVPALKNEIHTKLVISPSHRGSSLAFNFGK